MAQFSELAAVAYQKERVAARRLERTAGLAAEQALAQVLLEAAGGGSLADLIAQRQAAQAVRAAQRAARQQRKAESLARKTLLAAGPSQSSGSAWHAWFDGSSHPNPGKMGLGALLQGPRGERIEICAAAGHGDSNEAEYLALIALLEAALRVKPETLVLFGDSQVVLGDVAKAPGSGARALAAYRERAQGLLAQLGNVSLNWIARHKNAAADRLSQRAVGLPTGTTANTSMQADNA